MRNIVSALENADLETEQYKSRKFDKVFIKIRASRERLEEEADRLNMKFRLDERNVKQRLLDGQPDPLNPDEYDVYPRKNGWLYKGFQMELGKSALLEIEPRIFVVVSSSKPQMADRELYKFIGVNPEKMRILVNKSSVHFRADFEPIAKEIIVAKSDGAMSTNMDELTWKKINKKIKLMPPK